VRRGDYLDPHRAILQHSRIGVIARRSDISSRIVSRNVFTKEQPRGRFPLIWAKATTSDGRFDFDRGAAFKGSGWADAPPDALYVVRKPCVAVQRTSSRGQKRRLNAAAISKPFIQKHGGVIGENHVILLVPVSADAVPPALLAEALNQAAVSTELDRVCGSASISVRLLETVHLGERPIAARPDKERGRVRASGRHDAALSTAGA
jgi:hypothetical protein